MTTKDQRSRNWIFTLNNWTVSEKTRLEHIDVKYIFWGEEIAPTTGTPHLQGFLVLKNAKTLEALKTFIGLNRLSLRIMNGKIEQNIAYCKKDGVNIYERGERPKTQEEKGEAGKKAIQERWALAKEGKLEELPPEQIRIYQYIHNKYRKVSNRDTLENFWVYGESGVGKSSGVRRVFPENLYVKNISKWWDGYEHEETVLIEDVAPEHAGILNHFLKIWGDHYAFNAETKGGMLKIRPKRIIITSQYNIFQVFQSMDDQTLAAIGRRFKEIEVNTDRQLVLDDFTLN